jgi:hypothetical protein
MRYRVVFKERSDELGNKGENPSDMLDAELDEGTVLDARFVSRLEPDALHSSDEIEEDDGFLSISPEIWEYDVAEGRDEEFKDALRNSGVVIEFDALESSDELGLS